MNGKMATTTTLNSTSTGGGYWINGEWFPYDYTQTVYPLTYPTYPVTYYMQTVSEPQHCIGKAHVFECDHVTKCKCGAIARVMPKAKAKK